MSSLRLALKQSLQETGPVAPAKEKKKKKKQRDSITSPRPRGRPRQPGEPPRKRGRPPKNRPPIVDDSATSEQKAKESTEQHPGKASKHEEDEDDEVERQLDSENEFSYDSEMSNEEDEGEEDEEGEGDENEEESQDGQEKSSGAEPRNDEDVSGSEDERKKQRKLLKKQLKHSAANKIQSQWKKSKKLNQNNNEKRLDDDERMEDVGDPAGEGKATEEPPKKSTAKSKTVPAPLPEVLEWSRSLSDKKCKKNIAKGMRVKVRFATKVKRDGKMFKKKIWYGGRVSAASNDGSKIKIKYDDGTSEISRFPDKDVVVDDTDNGEHSASVMRAANKFKPLSKRDDETHDTMDEDQQQETTNSVEESNDTESTTANVDEQDVSQTTEKTGGAEVESKLDEVQSDDTGKSRVAADGVESATSTSEPVSEVQTTAQEKSTASEDKLTEKTMSIDEEEKAPKQEASEKEEERTEGSEEGDTNTSSLTIRIPNITPKKKQTSTDGVHDYSSEEELHADTPVTERKVKSIKVKRKRSSNDDLSDVPQTKKAKADNTTTSSKTKSEDALPLKKDGDEPLVGVDSESVEGPQLQTAPTLTPKTKKKKERATSPGPRGGKSPIRTPVKEEAAQPMALDLEADIAGSAQDYQETGSTGEKSGKIGSKDLEGTELTEQESANKDSVPRTGRKAAQEAKEKLSSKQDPSTLESTKKKKKRRRKEGSDGEESDEDDRQWVQCDKCKKWRILPSGILPESLPDLWYCNLNVYDPKHNDCNAPEQTVKQVAKEWRRAKKRAKQQRLQQAALEAGQDDSLKKDTSTTAKDAVATSPKASKSTSAGETVSEATVLPSESTPEPPVKRGRKPKNKPDPQKQNAQADSSATTKDKPAETSPKKPGRKRGRPARNAAALEAARREAAEKKDDDNVEWVQCEKCEKWRKLPPYMAADELPDTWYCTMNTWNPDSASCDAPEDKADAHHQEVGAFGNFSQGHAGKYSYRALIFGNGKKQNRPMSEKARAAESLFMRPIDDEENPNPSVMYSKSSMFLPRTSNFNRPPAVEKKTASIFDILSDSELWAELRGVGQPMHGFYDESGNSFHKATTFDSLPKEMKEVMREVVLEALGAFVLTGDDIINGARLFPWESLSDGLSQIRGYINADIIINTLLGLVKDGIVEMTCFKDPTLPITQWVPRYRKVDRVRREVEAEDALKSSRCMKIAKPWKRTDASEWVTGSDMNA